LLAEDEGGSGTGATGVGAQGFGDIGDAGTAQQDEGERPKGTRMPLSSASKPIPSLASWRLTYSWPLRQSLAL